MSGSLLVRGEVYCHVPPVVLANNASDPERKLYHPSTLMTDVVTRPTEPALDLFSIMVSQGARVTANCALLLYTTAVK